MSYLPKDQRRAQIVEAALALMREEGLAEATVRAVAARIGTSPGQIHHHFTSADALRAEAFRCFGQRMGCEFKARYAGLSGIDRVVAMLSTGNAICDAGVQRMWKEAVAASQMESLIQEAVVEVLRAWQADVTRALTETLEIRGQVAVCDLSPVACRLVGFSIGCDLMRDLGIDVSFNVTELRQHLEIELAAAAGQKMDHPVGA